MLFVFNPGQFWRSHIWESQIYNRPSRFTPMVWVFEAWWRCWVCVCVLGRVWIKRLLIILCRNILKDRKLLQQVNDSAVGVVHPPKALPERPRSPFFKRIREQPIPSAPDNSSLVSYMQKWQVSRLSLFLWWCIYLTLTYLVRRENKRI